MIKIFETGDIHIGRKFLRYKEEVRKKLSESRFECLQNMIKEAETEGCDLFVVTGDLFDRVTNISYEYIKRTVEILASFGGIVLILPGNHDYYTEEAKVWKNFESAMGKVEHNIILLNEFKKIIINEGGEQVNIYPAYCDDKHSSKNRISWIKDLYIDTNTYNIGVAHGAIQGVTPDMDGRYYQMTEAELLGISMDVWLIGHTHIPYPRMEIGKEYKGHKIYNAGTPEQLHFDNNTLGYGFIITITKESGTTEITAKACRTGKILYYDKHIHITAENSAEHVLKNAIKKEISELGRYDIVKLSIDGTVSQEEYEREYRSKIYNELLCKLMDYEINDGNLSERITRDRIYAEFPEIGFAAQLLETLLDDPIEVQMAYDLLKECRE